MPFSKLYWYNFVAFIAVIINICNIISLSPVHWRLCAITSLYTSARLSLA